MNNREHLKEYNGNLSQLRKIINSFEIIPNAPTNEFDKLNNKILSQLYKEIDSKKIKNIIESELVVTYGLFNDEFDSDHILSQIISWWNAKI